MNANEKAIDAACDAYHADLPTHDYPSRWAMEQAIAAYLAALADAEATPPDVAGVVPVAWQWSWLNGSEGGFTSVKPSPAKGVTITPLYSADTLTTLSAENDRLRGELARVERETVERCAGVADDHAQELNRRLQPHRRRITASEHDIAVFESAESAAEEIATAIRNLEPRHD